jgi:hypothetical protein
MLPLPELMNRHIMMVLFLGNLIQFHPTGLSELRNRNIVIGGPTHLCDFSKCKINDCELAKNSSGLLHVFSPEGEFLYEISAIGYYYVYVTIAGN